MLSFVRFFVTSWTIAHQAPLSMGFFRQEYLSRLPFPSPGVFLTQGLNSHPCVSCFGRHILYHWATLHAKLLQSCLSLCDVVDCSPPGSTVYGILRQEYWSGLPCPPPRYCPYPGREPASLMSLVLAGRFFNPSTTWEA